MLPDTPPFRMSHSVEGRGSVSRENLALAPLHDTVGKGKLETLGEELLDVWSLDIVGLRELDNLQDLPGNISKRSHVQGVVHTWIDRNRERCLAAIS